MKYFILMIFILFLSSIDSFAQADSDIKLKSFIKSIEEEEIGNYSNAVKEIESIYSSYNDDYLVNLRLGWLYYLLKDYKKSMNFYSQSKTLSNSSIESLFGLTYPLSALDKWEEIEEIYNLILDKDPLNYTANLRLGQIFYNRQNYLNARKRFEMILENYPSDYETNLYMGYTYYALGGNSKAHQYFTNALIADPDDNYAKEGLNLTK